MSQFQNLLNALIESKLLKINSAILFTIKFQGLEPMFHITSGSDTTGRTNLKICTAEAVASYSLQNLTGLFNYVAVLTKDVKIFDLFIM